MNGSSFIAMKGVISFKMNVIETRVYCSNACYSLGVDVERPLLVNEIFEKVQL